MPRVKRAVATKAHKKKITKAAKGAYGKRKNVYRRAKETVQRAMVFATEARRAVKRDYRSLWTVRINAALEEHDMSYSRFIGDLKKANIVINRKMLAEMAVNDKPAFISIVKKVQKS